MSTPTTTRDVRVRSSANADGFAGGGSEAATARFGRWITVAQENPSAPVRLFCLPYAGGNAQVFRGWAAALPEVEVATVHLPGRGARLLDEPYTRMEPLVDDLGAALTGWLDRPFAVFGHSMGARIGFELVRRLRRSGAPDPLALLVSSCKAPHVPQVPAPPLAALPDHLFIGMLKRMNGTPPEVFDHPELVQLVLPVLRADFTVVNEYSYTDEPALPCPIRAFGGTADTEAREDDLLAWQVQTRSSFRLTMLPGGHFTISTVATEMLAGIRAQLAELAG